MSYARNKVPLMIAIVTMALILLGMSVSDAGAQTRTIRQIGLEDIKHGGTFYRPSRLSVGDSVQLHGVTPYNVLAFGVDNTGATDCAESLQAVIDLVGAAGGGAAYVPSGDYLLESAITISSDNVEIIFDGANIGVGHSGVGIHVDGADKFKITGNLYISYRGS